MANQLHCTGPAILFANVGSASAVVQVATCERAPRISLIPRFRDIYNDIAGDSVPIDRQFMGEHAIITADLTRFDMTYYNKMAARPTLGGTRGTYAIGDYGSFMVQESKNFVMWVQFPYSAKSAMSALPAAYRFVSCQMQGPDDFEIGMAPMKIRVSFFAEPTFTFSTNNQPVFVTYDNSASGLPAAA